MIILFSGIAPHPIAEELLSLGVLIREAIAISEVFRLIELYPDAPILITSDVDSDRAKLIQQRHSTLYLKPSATARDVLWELSDLISASDKPV